eukprot:Gb_10937 [translate_table: standard]
MAMESGTVNPNHFNFDRYTSLSAYAADLLTILDELKVEKCSYVGHSVSAMVGCIASIKRPELFQNLILLCASPRYLNDESYEGGFERGDIDELLSRMKSDYGAWASGFAPLAVGVDEPSLVEEFSRTMLSMKPDIAFTIIKTAFDSDMRSILGEVKTPCSIIQTTKDTGVPMGVAHYLQCHLGGTTSIEILETDGHLPHMTSPDLFLQVLAESETQSWIPKIYHGSLVAREEDIMLKCNALLLHLENSECD